MLNYLSALKHVTRDKYKPLSKIQNKHYHDFIHNQDVKQNLNKKRSWQECSEVWGPPYWFVFHSIAKTYPEKPTNVSKKKYYDFIQNIPIFLPCHELGDAFAEMLELYPVTPYLDSRKSLVKWFCFIHNRINVSLDKETYSYDEAEFEYFKHYFNNKNLLLKEDKTYFSHNLKKRNIYKYCIYLIMVIVVTWFSHSLLDS